MKIADDNFRRYHGKFNPVYVYQNVLFTLAPDKVSADMRARRRRVACEAS